MEPEITNLVRELATQLGVGAEYLWSAMVRLQRWEAVIYLLNAVILFFWIWFGMVPMVKTWGAVKPRDHCDPFSAKQAVTAILCLLTGFWVIGILSSMGRLIGFVDPEAVAIADLLRKLGGS